MPHAQNILPVILFICVVNKISESAELSVFWP